MVVESYQLTYSFSTLLYKLEIRVILNFLHYDDFLSSMPTWYSVMLRGIVFCRRQEREEQRYLVSTYGM